MGEGNLVVFKGTVDGIIVLLDNEAPFDEVMCHFKEKLNQSKSFFKGTNISIRFKGRLLSTQEQDALMKLLSTQNIINISFVHPFMMNTCYGLKMSWNLYMVP